MKKVATAFILAQSIFLLSCADNADELQSKNAAKPSFSGAEVNLKQEPVSGPDEIIDPESAIIALQFYIDEARLGSAYAQLTVGESYIDGILVPVNYIEAYAWLKVAKSQTIDEAEPLMGIAWEAMDAKARGYAEELGNHYIEIYGAL